MEVFFNKLVSEFRVEWSAVGHEGAGFSNISNKLELKTLVLVGVLDPSFFVILERVNKSVGLVHLPSGLHGLVLEGLLGRHLVIELLSELLLDGIALIQLGLSSSQVLLSFLQLGSFDFKLLELGLHNLGLLVVITHGGSPNTHTLQGIGSGLGNIWGEGLVSILLLQFEIWFQEFNGFLINVILVVLGEVDQHVKELWVLQSLLGSNVWHFEGVSNEL